MCASGIVLWDEPSQIALAWLLAIAPNILLIPGTSSRRHLAENLATASLSLEEDEVASLAEGIHLRANPGLTRVRFGMRLPNNATPQSHSWPTPSGGAFFTYPTHRYCGFEGVLLHSMEIR
jgi:hypothetical protein